MELDDWTNDLLEHAVSIIYGSEQTSESCPMCQELRDIWLLSPDAVRPGVEAETGQEHDG